VRDHVFPLEPRRLFSYDLALTSLAPGATSVRQGASLSAVATVINHGSTAFGGGSVYFDFSQSALPANPPRFVGAFGQVALPALAPGQSVQLSLSYAVPNGFPVGKFFFSAIATERTAPILDPNAGNLGFRGADANDADNGLSAAGEISVLNAQSTVGRPDANFGSNGQAVTEVPQTFNFASSAYDPTTGNEYAVVTLTTANGTRTAVLRVLPDGSVDDSYGNLTGGVFDPGSGAPNSTAKSITRLSDGSYLAIGMTSDNNVVLFRLGADGSLVSSFGTGGIDVLNPSSTNGLTQFDVTTVLSTPDHNAYLVGTAGVAGLRLLIVLKLTGDSTPDPTFGLNGIAMVSDPLGGAETAEAGTILSDGRVVVAGSADRNGTYSALAAVLLPSGLLDPAFARGGRYNTAASTSYRAYTAVAADAEDNIYLGGFETNAAETGSSVLVTKLTSAGKPAGGFGSGGNALLSTGDDYASAASVIPTADGGAIVSARTATSSTNVASGDYGASLLRVSDAGAFLKPFANNGVLVVTSAPATPSFVIAPDDSTSYDSYASSSAAEATSVGGGEVRLLASTSSTNANDADATNLTATQIVADGIDLSATTTTVVSGSALAGKATGSLKLAISNLGTLSSSGKSTIALMLVSSIGSASGVALTSSTATLVVSPGTTKYDTVKFTYPASVTTPTDYYVAATVTLPSTLTDIDLTNNTATASGVVKVGSAFSDLSFTIDEPVKLAAGATNTVKLAAANAGNAAATGASAAELVLVDSSGNTLLDLGSVDLSATVRANGSATISLRSKIAKTVTLPTGAYLEITLSGKILSLDLTPTNNSATTSATAT
jgi:uncharacterized delta-60 repeat protein